MLGNRSVRQALCALVEKTHYIAFVGMFRVYKNVPDAFRRYLLGKGEYPVSICINTPVGLREVRLYSHHDMLTVNEIFCRNDYPAEQNLRAVVDIGANIGLSAFYFMTRNNQARCYLFEPDPKNIGRLRQQLKSFEGRYELEECAVSDFDGKVTFGVESTGRYGGIGVKTEQEITVDCRHINGILREVIGRERIIDVVKIDTEGAEIATVKAIDAELLGNIRHIFIEAHPEEDLLLGKFKQQQYGSICQLANVELGGA